VSAVPGNAIPGLIVPGDPGPQAVGPFSATALPPPAVPVFPAGYGPLPADFNGWVQAPLGFLTGQVVFRGAQTVTQSYTAGSNNVIRYDTVNEDPYAGWNGSPSWWWLAPYTGWYEIIVTVSLAATTNYAQAAIFVTGGTQQYISSEHQGPAGTFGGAGAYAIVALTGGVDYVQGIVMPVTSTVSNDVSAPGRYPRLTISYLSQ
jgi:hypothetical protein